MATKVAAKASVKAAVKAPVKATAKATTKKAPFGGYGVTFQGCDETLEQLFGKKQITPSDMTKILWAYVKKNKLGGKE